MEYLAIDLETTGFDPERDRVIEIGAVAFSEAGVRGRLERLVNPGRAVPDAVLRLTGINSRELARAPGPEVALHELGELMRGRTPVGHGARLDVDFLAAAGRWPQGAEILDTLDLARILLPASPSHSLPALAEELGLDQPRPHRALDDADATRQLLVHLRERAVALEAGLRAEMLAAVSPYGWPLARFFAEALTAAAPAAPAPPPASHGSRPAPAASWRTDEPDDDPAAVLRLLDEGGPLAAVLPGYERRESQLQMSLAVAQTLRRGGTLVVEAGTGTGKSLAYLVPAAARARRRGERVVVATHTLGLQEQLVGRDIPALQEWLPWTFAAALLKGRSNYVSLRRWQAYLAEACGDSGELAFKLKVLMWIRATATGDRSELRIHGPEEPYWTRIASDSLDCLGFRCTEEGCFVHRARARAERADVVVVNHALLVADAVTGGGLIPGFEHLVVDEAHHLEEAATGGMRCEVEEAALIALLERLAAVDAAGHRTGLIEELRGRPPLGASLEALDAAGPLAGTARERAEALFDEAGDWMRDVAESDTGRPRDAFRITPEQVAVPGWAPLAVAAGDAATALSALNAMLERAVGLSREWLGGDDPVHDLRELDLARGRLAEAAAVIGEAGGDRDPERVYWFAPSRSGGAVLRSAPVEVGGTLAETVFGPRSSVVLTSASLAVAGSFDYFCGRTGVSPAAETLVLPSPFDYLTQSLVCLPTDMPDPQADGFTEMVEEAIAAIAGRLRGRTLALFTSHRQLRDVYTALKHRNDLDDVLILGQGLDGQRRQVLVTFEESPRALLLGTAGLWEGIDIPGERLSCVIIVRLPFPVPTEPVFAARSERLRDPFLQYALPLAALRLKQGFGRLIRRADDRGAVVILDGRIVARDYGRAFLDALPPAARFVGPVAEVGEQVEGWVAAGTAP